MIYLIFRIMGYWLMKNLGFPHLMPMNYTVSLLYTCNSRCSTCNIWKKQANNLSVDEYKKIFKHIKHTLTGLLLAEVNLFCVMIL